MRFAGIVTKMLVVAVLAVSAARTVVGQAVSEQRADNYGVEILTDTQGVDFGPYLKQVLGQIRKNWVTLLPPEARPPQNVASDSVIRITIAPNGRLSAMRLERSDRKGDFDRAAWGAVTQVGSFPRLPEAFTGTHLELRINFAVNQKGLPANGPEVPLGQGKGI